MFATIFNASISKRIFVATLVPIIGIALFGAYIVSVEYSRYASLGKLYTLASVAPKISMMVHELQNERGLSSTFIYANGENPWKDRLDAQITKTDTVLASVIEDLHAFPASDYGIDVEERLTSSLAEFDKLAGFRDRTLSMRTTVTSTSLYYTETIRKLLDVVATISSIANDAEIKGRSTAYVSLLETKERAGLERAMGAKGYSAGNFDSATHTNLVTLIGQQDSFMKIFNAYASEDERTFYETTVAGPIVDEVEYQRDVAVEAGYDEIYDTITAEMWFDNITAKIDLIKQVEDYVSTNLISSAQNALSNAQAKLLLTLSFTLASLVIAGAACFFVGRSITKPLSKLQNTMGIVAGGSFDVEIDGSHRTDEIGDMARAVEVFRDQGLASEQLKKDQLEAEQRAAEEKRAELNRMADDLESSIGHMIDGLTSSSSQLEQTARSMQELAASTNTEAGAVSEASAHATRNVETVASAATELSSAISDVTDQINLSSELTVASRAASEKTDGQMKNLAEAAGRIGSVMELIQEIAEQTNLLALNATIEAARAGEAGKGFAVVASEVKDLANQTAKATGEISQNVSRVQEETQSAALAMSEISQKISEINNVTSTVSAAVAQQSVATHEISRNAEETVAMNRNVSASIDTVRSAAQQTGSAASQVLSSAEELSQTAETLREQVGTFVRSIRAA